MHDIRWIRDNPEAFDAGLAKRGIEPLSAGLLALDEHRREMIGRTQAMQERRNAASKEVGQAKAQRDEARAQALIAEVAELKVGLPAAEKELGAVEADLQKALAEIPNIPGDDVPEGENEHGNLLLRTWGTPRLKSHGEHFEIGEVLGLMDFETAAKLSGSRFVVLKGKLARLERALAQFMLDLHTDQHGYLEVAPPLLVRDEAMFGTAQLPKFRDDQFKVDRLAEHNVRLFLAHLEDPATVDAQRLMQLAHHYKSVKAESIAGKWSSSDAKDQVLYLLDFFREILTICESNWAPLWLIPTAEVPLTNLVRESILSEDELPLRFTAATPCFRAEAGAAGRDTRGMIRQHQFTKVEMVSITTPEQSAEEHERMLGCAEVVLQKLDLPYRIMTLCTGDMGFSAKKTYDLEVWLPGQKAYREISSVSVCGDFQARRMDARYRPADGKGTRFVHTLNGSGVAVGRALVAVLENYVEEDGSVAVPSVLVPYMGGTTKIERTA